MEGEFDKGTLNRQWWQWKPPWGPRISSHQQIGKHTSTQIHWPTLANQRMAQITLKSKRKFLTYHCTGTTPCKRWQKVFETVYNPKELGYIRIDPGGIRLCCLLLISQFLLWNAQPSLKPKPRPTSSRHFCDFKTPIGLDLAPRLITGGSTRVLSPAGWLMFVHYIRLKPQHTPLIVDRNPIYIYIWLGHHHWFKILGKLA